MKKCLSKNKRQPQKLSEAIQLLRYLVLPLHLVSHDTKSNHLETISSPLIAVYLPNSHKSLICIHSSLCLYFLFLSYRIIFGIFELFQGIYLHVWILQIMEATLCQGPIRETNLLGVERRSTVFTFSFRMGN